MLYRPRVHGNGFIQLDLTPTRRLHIWGHPAIPKQVSHTPHHDHAFAFTSKVLIGSILNHRYTWIPNPIIGNYQVHKVNVRDREDTTLHATGEYGDLYFQGQELIKAGESYRMEVGQIHTSNPLELSVSIIEKEGLTLSQGGPTPRVFVRNGIYPDNTFGRYDVDEKRLWEIISDVFLGIF